MGQKIHCLLLVVASIETTKIKWCFRCAHAIFNVYNRSKGLEYQDDNITIAWQIIAIKLCQMSFKNSLSQATHCLLECAHLLTSTSVSLHQSNRKKCLWVICLQYRNSSEINHPFEKFSLKEAKKCTFIESTTSKNIYSKPLLTRQLFLVCVQRYVCWNWNFVIKMIIVMKGGKELWCINRKGDVIYSFFHRKSCIRSSLSESKHENECDVD